MVKTRNKTLIAVIWAVLLLVATFLSGYFLIQEKEIVVNERKKLAQLEYDLILLDKVLVDQKKYQQEINAVTRTLPASLEEVSFFVSQIERLAAINSQIIETKIEETAAAEANSLSSLKFNLKTSGDYQGLAAMLTDLTFLPYHTQVDSLKIEKKESLIDSLTNFRLFLRPEETP